MKQIVFFLFFGLSCIILPSCDTEKMCDKDDDCMNICRAYDSNKIYYACVDDACKCVSKDKITCDGSAEETVCIDICKEFAPDKIPVCEDTLCACRTEEELAAENAENGESSSN